MMQTFSLVPNKKCFSYFSTKTYVVGTQKNRLNETVLLSTQNIHFKCWLRKYLQLYAEIFFILILPSVSYNELEMDHCTYQGVTVQNFQLKMCFSPLTFLSKHTEQTTMKCSGQRHFI